MNINDTIHRRCQDCGEEFEVIDPDCKAEVRCLYCQCQFRITGKTALERYVDALAERMETDKKSVREELRASLEKMSC